MNKILATNKENTAGTFYNTPLPYNHDNQQFASSLRQLEANYANIELLVDQADLLLNRLGQKIGQDELKTQNNYQQLNEVSKQIEQFHFASNNDKETDQLIKTQKETVKELYNQDRKQLEHIHQKYQQELATYTEALEFKEKEIGYEKEQRDSSWSKLIDLFQKQIVELEKQFKNIRNQEDQKEEQNSVDLFHLEEQLQNKIEQETTRRKQQHQTIIKLVAECIENIRYIY